MYVNASLMFLLKPVLVILGDPFSHGGSNLDRRGESLLTSPDVACHGCDFLCLVGFLISSNAYVFQY